MPPGPTITYVDISLDSGYYHADWTGVNLAEAWGTVRFYEWQAEQWILVAAESDVYLGDLAITTDDLCELEGPHRASVQPEGGIEVFSADVFLTP